MITAWDDYFIHQTPRPIWEPCTEDEHWMDRFWWGGLTEDASTYLAVSLGQYRTTQRMDAIVYVIQQDSHRILRLAKRLLPEDYVQPRIGPLTFDIVRPLEIWRWSLADNPARIAWNLQYTAGRRLHEYRQFVYGDVPGDTSDYHHFVQNGRSTGSVEVDGKAVSFQYLVTTRDRSWGIRRSRERLGFFLWIHHSFASKDVCAIYTQRRDGSVAYLDGSITDDSGQHRIVALGHDLKLGAGNDVEGGSVQLLDEHGALHRVDYERVLKGFPGPVGYGGWAGKDHSSEMTAQDGYLVDSSEFDVSRPPAKIIAELPVHIFEHPSRVWLNGTEPTVGIMSGGVTRSTAFQYRPRAPERLPHE